MVSRVPKNTVLVVSILIIALVLYGLTFLYRQNTTNQNGVNEVEEIEIVGMYLKNCSSKISEDLSIGRSHLSTLENMIDALEDLADGCPEKNEEMKQELAAMKIAVDALQGIYDLIEMEAQTLDVESIIGNYTK